MDTTHLFYFSTFSLVAGVFIVAALVGTGCYYTAALMLKGLPFKRALRINLRAFKNEW